jgi:diguanylate cyclase (GGDEF)-like protein
MLAISAAYFLRVYKTLIIDQVQNSPWLNIGIVVYFALVVAFFLGYVAEVFRGASLGLSLACILFFESLFVLATIVLIARLFMNIKQVKCNQLDLLTGVFTKTAFDSLVGEALRCKNGSLEGAALAVMDLDRFKQVNDTIGHLKGDEVLVMAVDKIRAHLMHGEICARFGGDEFVVFSPREHADSFELRTKLMQQDVCAAAKLICPDVALTMSVGIAFFRDGRPREAVFAEADRLMYEHKRQTR